MTWKKQGLTFEPTYDFEWMQTHAQLPVADHLEGDEYRIYFSGRNDDNMSQIGYIEVDITAPEKTLTVSEDPVVELGDLGTFDDSGVYPSAVVDLGDEKRLYYIGWMQGKRVSYYASVGLAISYDGGKTFQKHSRGPHLTRNDVDPFMTLSSDVRRFNDKWHMWYTSATDWEKTVDGSVRPNYHIKYAKSEDGLNWERNGSVAVDYEHEGEWAIARPCVISDSDGYKMWYCYAVGNEGYRIGYAESSNLKEWNRKDSEVGISVSADGWDSDIIEYPYVFDHGEERYMLYNGNYYGKGGFGLARWTDD